MLCVALAFTGCVRMDDVDSSSKEKKAAPVIVNNESDGKGYNGSEDETYYMVTFLNGHPYWTGCYAGMQDAAEHLGVNTKYGGSQEYDINKAVASFEQIVATRPDGILLACMNPEPFIEAIDNAMAAGVPVVTFDTDSPNSNRLAYASTDNTFVGEKVARYVAEELTDGNAEIGVIGRPGQLNIERRIIGFKKKIEEYPGLKIVAEADNGGDIVKAAAAASAMIQANPGISVIFGADTIGAPGAAQACEELGRDDIAIFAVDSTDDILALIKAGKLHATVAQNTYNQGYWAMMMMFSYTHSLVDPFTSWKEDGGSPLPPYINTGVDLIKADNTDAFSVE